MATMAAMAMAMAMAMATMASSDQLAVVVDEAAEVAAMAAAAQQRDQDSQDSRDSQDNQDQRKQRRALAGVGGVIIEGGDIRRWRRAAWLTQAELARRVRLPRQSLCDWEAGRCPIPRTHYTALLMVLTAARTEADALQAAMADLNEL